jgi:hypothetical protein
MRTLMSLRTELYHLKGIMQGFSQEASGELPAFTQPEKVIFFQNLSERMFQLAQLCQQELDLIRSQEDADSPSP